MDITMFTIVSASLKVKQSPVNMSIDYSPGFQIVLLQFYKI